MAKATLAFFLFSIPLISGCGGASMTMAPQASTAQSFTASQVFNTDMIGQTWTFQDAYGDTTMIDVEAAPDDAAGTHGTHVILHFTKNADRAYWGPGIAQAEDHFMLLQMADGGWRGVADIPTFPLSCPWCAGHMAQTINMHSVPGQPDPYQIIPASATTAKVTKIPTAFDWWLLWDVNTMDDVSGNPSATDMGSRTWESDFSVEQVNTPAYSGPAVVSHQFEGTCGAQWCNEEKWYFAPKMGLVEIQPLGVVPSPSDPNITIKRVH